MTVSKLPATPAAAIAALGRTYLETVVAIESSSDPESASFPSTIGQLHLAAQLGDFFARHGAAVTQDAGANLIAALPGRGRCAGLSPLLLMVHLDTAHGTQALPRLLLCEKWDGRDVPYPGNPRLRVNLRNYPDAAPYLGHDLLHGDGVAPFGLDDKLGMAQLMTLVRILADEPEIPHRPLFLVARPDEELSYTKTLGELGDWLVARGVSLGYTVDGHLPFEINLDNFYALGGSVGFRCRPFAVREEEATEVLDIQIHGVNTHPATARSEGSCGAVRLAAELLGELAGHKVRALFFASAPSRECDGVLRLAVDGAAGRLALTQAVAKVIAPHECHGAGVTIAASHDRRGDSGIEELLTFVRAFLAGRTEEPLLAEDSSGFHGYTHPTRVRPESDQLWLDFRIRDFALDKLSARCAYLTACAAGRPMAIRHQYDNLGPRLTRRTELLGRAQAAAQALGQALHCLPVRGGTGVDALVERGICTANLGTGYFAPESEKEFTSLQFMAQHITWLVALVQQ